MAKEKVKDGGPEPLRAHALTVVESETGLRRTSKMDLHSVIDSSEQWRICFPDGAADIFRSSRYAMLRFQYFGNTSSRLQHPARMTSLLLNYLPQLPPLLMVVAVLRWSSGDGVVTTCPFFIVLFPQTNQFIYII
jgi:hypothetical protein